ncbi:MAG TPA: nucleotidyltransferase family protein [Vicinamibacterales bacterium]
MIPGYDVERLRRATIPPDASIGAAVARLEDAGTGMLVLCDPDGSLCGVLTDGDVRRALLKRVPFDRPCREIATTDPVVAVDPLTEEDALRLMDQGAAFPIDHLPVLDPAGRVIGLLLRRDLVTVGDLGLAAVIMAGGFGTRLQPLTNDTPKPMLPVGDRPLLELTIERLRSAGIRRVNITTHYLADRITEHFGNGDAFGVDVRYVAEDRPLGTAGALRLIDAGPEPLLVINGDVLTRVDFRDMAAFHRAAGAMATIGVRPVEFVFPYGVVEADEHGVHGLHEKPRLSYLVNAGVYLVEPAAFAYIPEGRRYDMTDLIDRLLAERHRVVSFPIVESWIDIGRHGDYALAQDMVPHGQL